MKRTLAVMVAVLLSACSAATSKGVDDPYKKAGHGPGGPHLDARRDISADPDTRASKNGGLEGTPQTDPHRDLARPILQ